MPDIFIAENGVGGKNPESLLPKKGEEDKNYFKTPSALAEKSNKHSLVGHSHSALSAFYYYPDKVRFINKDPEEKIVLLLRKHPVTNLKWLLASFILLVMPSAVSALPFFDPVPARFLVIGTSIWYLATLAFVFEKFLSWFFNVSIITDERIIDVNFYSLLYREITDANIDHIEDVTVEMGGAIRTFFNYGDVLVQTAAEVPRIDFEAVPHPDRVARVLRDLRIEEEQEKLEGRVR